MLSRITDAPDLAAFELAYADVLIAELAADRAGCDFFDSAAGWLWSEHALHLTGDERRADAGALGWTARTGEPLSFRRLERSAHWDPVVDACAGRGRMVTHAVRGSDGLVHAVLWAARDRARPVFDDEDARRAAALAALAGPLLEQLAARDAANPVNDAPGLFRREALRALTTVRHGDVLITTQGWAAIAAALVATAAAAVLALALEPVAPRRTVHAVVRGAWLELADAAELGTPIRFVSADRTVAAYAIATSPTSALVLGHVASGDGYADLLADDVRLYACLRGDC